MHPLFQSPLQPLSKNLAWVSRILNTHHKQTRNIQDTYHSSICPCRLVRLYSQHSLTFSPPAPPSGDAGDFPSCTVLMASAATFYSHYPRPASGVLASRRLALLMAGLSALEVHKAKEEHAPSLHLASKWVDHRGVGLEGRCGCKLVGRCPCISGEHWRCVHVHALMYVPVRVRVCSHLHTVYICCVCANDVCRLSMIALYTASYVVTSVALIYALAHPLCSVGAREHGSPDGLICAWLCLASQDNDTSYC